MMKWVKAGWWRRDSLINEIHTHTHYLSLSLTQTHTIQALSHTHTHTLTHNLSISLSHCHTHSLSLCHKHTHTFTRTHANTLQSKLATEGEKNQGNLLELSLVGRQWGRREERVRSWHWFFYDQWPNEVGPFDLRTSTIPDYFQRLSQKVVSDFNRCTKFHLDPIR